MRSFVFVAAAAVAALAGGAAWAGEADGVTRAHVSYADLNLSAAPDRVVLARRVGRAIADLCPAAPAADAGVLEAYRACRSVARASAARELDAAYRRHGGAMGPARAMAFGPGRP